MLSKYITSHFIILIPEYENVKSVMFTTEVRMVMNKKFAPLIIIYHPL